MNQGGATTIAKTGLRFEITKISSSLASASRSGANDLEALVNRLEFHRQALALLPVTTDRHPGVAILMLDPARNGQVRHCTCDQARRRTCRHQLELTEALRQLKSLDRTLFSAADLRASLWHRLAAFMAEGRRDESTSVRLSQVPGDPARVGIWGADGVCLMDYLSVGPDLARFVERCVTVSDKRRVPTRQQVLQILQRMTLNDHERVLVEMGHRTQGMAFEQSFWYQLAYHGFREWGANGVCWRPAIDPQSGDFEIEARNREERPIVRLSVPRARVKALLKQFGPDLSCDGGPAMAPVPLDVVFDARLRDDSNLEIAPRLRLVQQAGEYRTLAAIDFKRFQYGDLVYIPELNLMADMVAVELPGLLKSDQRTLIKGARIPFFLEEHRDAIESGRIAVADGGGRLRILARYDRLQVRGRRVDRDWCHLAVFYGFGNAAVSLARILAARREGTRFVATEEGWVDTQAEAFDEFEECLANAGTEPVDADADHLTVSPIKMLRLQALSLAPFEVIDPNGRDRWLDNLLAGRSEAPLPTIRGMTSTLRDYQQRGVEWLWYLYQNRFGGLLCDEMGLGKTHQVMALMAALAAEGSSDGPFLVVCPTSVLYHWENKMAGHVPGLRLALHYGPNRDLDRSLAGVDGFLTSYGVLLRDIALFRSIRFGLAILDEIQHVKNSQTKIYQAVGQVRAVVKIGLTGTPVENGLADLKSLFDLVVPGYLGGEERFKDRYIGPIETRRDENRRQQLQRLIHPFVLRRLKSSVAKELPGKIEDRLWCRLSQEQVKLYRDALEGRRSALLETLNDPRAKVPYIHIFALLNILKQICNHPAMLDGAGVEARQWRSGKWDLFTELLDDCLSGGQKVVVYSQYLKMIGLIQAHLATRQVPAAVLTGASRERGRIVERFQQDPDCRIFVGSLKAGGVGIDLTAASVVIHYDRWWNAAREDQATDRVHRIGQRRGVQVFKLVTEGTLEERIDAIIQNKKRMMESVVRPDDPEALKIFTREQLIALLALPGN